jgi:hypothetical protein
LVTKGKKAIRDKLNRGREIMTTNEGRPDDFDDVTAERRVTLWMTLIVATLMVAVSAYVLSFALFGPGTSGPAHRAAVSTMHARS